MKKIPTLFTRVFYTEEEHKHGIKEILPELSSPDLLVVLKNGTPTIKWDGTCVLYKKGKFYKRYDAKQGKTPPLNALPCEPTPDPITGHWPHWVEIDPTKPEDKWLYQVCSREQMWLMCMYGKELEEGTYEAVGPHWQRNPYHLKYDVLLKHGAAEIIDLDYENGPYSRTFEGIRQWLMDHNEEGIVFWYKGEPRCKIKRSDFGIPWNVKERKNDR